MRRKILYSFLIFIIIFIFTGCSNKSKDNFFKDPISKKDIRFNKILLDTAYLDKIEASYVGISNIANSKICFIDEMSGRIYFFDQEGAFIHHQLGRGKGPYEFPGGEMLCYCSIGNSHIFIDGSYSYYIFNEKWERSKTEYIDWQIEHSKNEMLKNPSPEMHGLYSPFYYKFILRGKGDYVYFPVKSQHPTFNFVHSSSYYKNARIIAKLNIQSGKVEELLGRYSPVYQNYKYIGQFSLINFDLAGNGDFYVSFEADSLIYHYDKNYNIKHVFGNRGVNMDLNYKEIASMVKFKSNYLDERESRGYYTWLEYIDKEKLLFRNYKKGNHSQNNGLQIFNNRGTMLADIDIPQDFMKVIGYIKPYFYSNIVVDEKFESMKIYRFKID